MSKRLVENCRHPIVACLAFSTRMFWRTPCPGPATLLGIPSGHSFSSIRLTPIASGRSGGRRGPWDSLKGLSESSATSPSGRSVGIALSPWFSDRNPWAPEFTSLTGISGSLTLSARCRVLPGVFSPSPRGRSMAPSRRWRPEGNRHAAGCTSPGRGPIAAASILARVGQLLGASAGTAHRIAPAALVTIRR